MKYLTFAIISILSTTLADGSNILFILPYPAPSHFFSFYPLMERLEERGHEVTVISPINPKNENLTLVDLNGVQKYFEMDFSVFRTQSRLKSIIGAYDIVDKFISRAMYHENFEQFIHSNEFHFDVVLLEVYYADAYLAVAKKFRAPVIGLIPQTLPTVYSWLTSNPIGYSYIPNMYSPFTDQMDFTQRLINTVFCLVHILAYEIKYFASNQKVINRHFDFLDNDQKDLKAMLDDISLLLVNSHHSMGYIRPYLPNTVEVAGIHLKPVKTLPKNIQHFMDKATNGVVYISFGTMVNPEKNTIWGDVIVEVFKSLAVDVIWKWNTTLIPNIPENFLIESWLPQNEILQHPNCKLFITHGGIHSLIESINAGVPLIGMPLFSDQYMNIATAEKLGIAISLKEIEPNSLRNAAQRILKDAEYKVKAKHRSKLFNNRLVDPLTTATYWVEHVIEHKGAQHLKSAASKLTWYQYIMLDVILFFIISLVIFIFIVKFIFKHITRFVRENFYSYIRLLIRNSSYFKKHEKIN